MSAEQFVQLGMRAVIRDLQDWAGEETTISGAQLRAYLLAQLIIAQDVDPLTTFADVQG